MWLEHEKRHQAIIQIQIYNEWKVHEKTKWQTQQTYVENHQR